MTRGIHTPALSRYPLVRRSLLMVPLHLISTGAQPRATAIARDVPSARACIACNPWGNDQQGVRATVIYYRAHRGQIEGKSGAGRFAPRGYKRGFDTKTLLYGSALLDTINPVRITVHLASVDAAYAGKATRRRAKKQERVRRRSEVPVQ
jgi:hypothetical protein